MIEIVSHKRWCCTLEKYVAFDYTIIVVNNLKNESCKVRVYTLHRYLIRYRATTGGYIFFIISLSHTTLSKQKAFTFTYKSSHTIVCVPELVHEALFTGTYKSDTGTRNEIKNTASCEIKKTDQSFHLSVRGFRGVSSLLLLLW